MPTPGGWLLLVLSGLLAASGPLFGLVELLAVGTAGVVVAVLSVLYVRCRGTLKVTTRTIRPQQVHVGENIRVQLELANPRFLPTPVLRLVDRFSFATQNATDHFGSPNVLLTPIPGRGDLTVSYRLTAVTRGRMESGPLAVTLADPLGVSTRRIETGPTAEALVYPAVVHIGPPPRRAGGTFDAVRCNPVTQSSDELYGMRPFQTGDDPRRIHWRLSAHHDELIVRQFEEFAPTHTTVVLDTRRALLNPPAEAVGDGERFEAMVSAAASICRAGQRRGDRVRLVTTAEFDSGYGSSSAHLYRIFEHLALVNPDHGSLEATVDRISHEPGGELLVAVVAALDGAEATALASVGSQFNSKTVVLFGEAEPTEQVDRFAAFRRPRPTQPLREAPPQVGVGTNLVMVEEPQGFADAWNELAVSAPLAYRTAAGPVSAEPPTLEILDRCP